MGGGYCGERVVGRPWHDGTHPGVELPLQRRWRWNLEPCLLILEKVGSCVGFSPFLSNLTPGPSIRGTAHFS